MKERLEEFELYRQKVCKKANILLLIGVLLIVLGIVFAMLFSSNEEAGDGLIFVFLIAFIAGIVLIAINSSMKTKLSVEFKNQFIIDYVKSIYPGCEYNPKLGISVDRILEPGFFQNPDRYYIEDYLKASFDDVPFEMSDFHFQEKHVTTDSKGNTRVTYVTYAKGRFMIFDFKRDFNKVVKVADNIAYGFNTRGLEKVETESIDFNKKFKTYATDGMTAFYVLTPQIQLKLLELESKFKGSMYFSFMKGKLYVAITDGVSILDINASKKISEDTMKIIESQLMLPASIINELGLSSEKYTIGDAI